MKALEPEALSGVIGDIYDCALSPDSWTETLVTINASMNSAYCTIAMADLAKDGLPVMAFHSPWDPYMLRVLNEKFGIEGVPGLKTVTFGDVDVPRSTMQDMSEDEFHATPFYREWVEPQGLREACTMKFAHTDQRVGLIASVIRADRDIVTENERRFMSIISAHIRRAALIGDLLDFERLETQSLRDTLSKIATPVYLVDQDASILFANESAEALLHSQHFTRSTGGCLQAQNPTMSAALLDAVRRCTGSNTDLGGRGIGIPIASAPGSVSVAYVLPLGKTAIRTSFVPAKAAVFISTSQQNLPPSQDILATLYDLTQAEARVMLAVGSGETPRQFAARLGLSDNTVKTHLGRVFSKAGVHRQSELVQIINNLASPIRNDAQVM
jgi:DNA-binding CsgD family transcriptional regulator/PAS domain-containing protein